MKMWTRMDNDIAKVVRKVSALLMMTRNFVLCFPCVKALREEELRLCLFAVCFREANFHYQIMLIGKILKNFSLVSSSNNTTFSNNLRALILTRHCPGNDITQRSPLLFEQLL
jgi:hypothetical protein